MDKNNEMQKPTLLLIIDTLKKGGAETLLVGILRQLNVKFEVILVTLSAECDFDEDEIKQQLDQVPNLQ